MTSCRVSAHSISICLESLRFYVTDGWSGYGMIQVHNGQLDGKLHPVQSARAFRVRLLLGSCLARLRASLGCFCRAHGPVPRGCGAFFCTHRAWLCTVQRNRGRVPGYGPETSCGNAPFRIGSWGHESVHTRLRRVRGRHAAPAYGWLCTRLADRSRYSPLACRLSDCGYEPGWISQSAVSTVGVRPSTNASYLTSLHVRASASLLTTVRDIRRRM